MKLHNVSAEQAREFLLRGKNYSNLELPDYFDFTPMLGDLSDLINSNMHLDVFSKMEKYLSECIRLGPIPEDANYKIVHNKDGQYAWRRFELIHPLIYVALVHLITTDTNWQIIQDVFIKSLAIENFECSSHVPFSENQKADQITNWWEFHEQRALELTLEFEIAGSTDIADCYGSLYTHAIPWALHGREESKKNKSTTSLLGNQIDKLLQAMHDGETKGIPQGSTLMDLLAELVLSYLDHEIFLGISEKKITNFKVIRHRDDYKIFAQTNQDVQEILQVISMTVLGVGFRMNPSKTRVSSDQIQISIKPDKLAWSGVPQGLSLINRVLFIQRFSKEFPNSSKVGFAIQSLAENLDEPNLSSVPNIRAIIAVIVDISFRNPDSFPRCLVLITKILDPLPESQRIEILQVIKAKLDKLPFGELTMIWIQRAALPNTFTFNFEIDLCRKVTNKETVLWPTSWIDDPEIQAFCKTVDVIDRNILASKKSLMSVDELLAFDIES